MTGRPPDPPLLVRRIRTAPSLPWFGKPATHHWQWRCRRCNTVSIARYRTQPAALEDALGHLTVWHTAYAGDPTTQEPA